MPEIFADATSAVSFPDNGAIFELDFQERGRPLPLSFKIQLVEVASIDLGSLETYCKGNTRIQGGQEMSLTAIQAVNILLRDAPLRNLVTISGRNRFFRPTGLKPLGGGVEVAAGIFQRVSASCVVVCLN